MTKAKTTRQKFEDNYDGPTRTLKNIPADLVAFESLGLGKLPRPIASALDDYVLGFTVWEPSSSARRAATETGLEAARGDQNVADAKAVSDLLRKGSEGFGKLAAVLEDIDIVAKAEAEHASAVRTASAVSNATKGQMIYLNRLVGGEYRDAILKVLDKAWQEFVIVSTTSETKLGELHRLESVSADARQLCGRILSWVEGQNNRRGVGQAEFKLLREALKEEWDQLPTLERIEALKAQQVSQSPEAIAEVEAKSASAAEREENIRYAQQSAEARQVRLKGVTANAEAARTKNSEETSEEVPERVAS